MAAPTNFLSPQEANKIARNEGVKTPDGGMWQRGVKVSPGDAARSVATSAVATAYDGQTGQYGNAMKPVDAQAIGQQAYNNYLSPAPAQAGAPAASSNYVYATPTTDFEEVSPFDTRAIGHLDNIDPITGRVKIPKMRFKEGGAVHGPGSGTSDSIDAKLSNGEFVIPAHKVKEIGVENLDAYFGTDSSKKKNGYAEGGANVNESLQYLKKLGYDRRVLGGLMASKQFQLIIDRANAELAREGQLAAIDARDKALNARDTAASERENAAQGYAAALQAKAVDRVLELIKSPAGVKLLATPHLVAVKGGGEYGEVTTQQEVRPAIVFANPAAPTDDELESAAALLLGASKGDPLVVQAQRVATDVDRVQGAASRTADAKSKAADAEYQFHYERVAKMGPVAPDLRPSSNVPKATPEAIAAEDRANRDFLENKQQVAQALVSRERERAVKSGMVTDVNYAGGPGAYYSPDAPGVKFATLEELRMATTPVSDALPTGSANPEWRDTVQTDIANRANARVPETVPGVPPRANAAMANNEGLDYLSPKPTPAPVNPPPPAGMEVDPATGTLRYKAGLSATWDRIKPTPVTGSLVSSGDPSVQLRQLNNQIAQYEKDELTNSTGYKDAIARRTQLTTPAQAYLSGQ